MSKSFEELISKANQKTLKKVSVSNAQDEPVLQAVKAAKEQNIATAILVGDEAKIREIAASIDMDLTDFEIINEPDTEAAALKAVELVHNGKADILLKGLLETKTFLKSVLNKEVGLRTGKMLSHVCVFEIEGINRLLFFTDVAFNTYPTLADKVNIINNAVEVAHACGIECPKVAPLCAVETVNPKMQPTVDADNLTKMYEGGDFKGCQIYGPLSMDLAIDPEAAVHKGVTNPVSSSAIAFRTPLGLASADSSLNASKARISSPDWLAYGVSVFMQRVELELASSPTPKASKSPASAMA